jgi:hypothetical protein
MNRNLTREHFRVLWRGPLPLAEPRVSRARAANDLSRERLRCQRLAMAARHEEGEYPSWIRTVTKFAGSCLGFYLVGTSTGAPLSFTKNTTNFAGLVWLAFRPTT